MKRVYPILAAVLLCSCAGAGNENSTSSASETPPSTSSSSASITTTVTSTGTQPASAAETKTVTSQTVTSTVSESILPDPPAEPDLDFKNTDGIGSRYEFTYKGEVFTAVYTPDNWKIINSYKIDDENDMLLICKTLSEEHPVHGKDMTSYRVPEDMVYEWQQHNLAYRILPDSSKWKANARDVDLNPEDQGRNLYEMFLARTEKQR